MEAKTCNYVQQFPNDKLNHCMAYSYAIRTDGLHWSHYPICKEDVCPLRHERLLEGATLKTCYNCGQIGFTCGDCIKRSEWISKTKNK